MSNIVNTLVEMGFSQEKSELAVSNTGGQRIEDAMEWILAHADDAVPQDTNQSGTPSVETSKNDPEQSNEPTSETSDGTVAKSLKCDECGKLFSNQMEVEFHAGKSGHSSFSESTEEKRQLTEEEKLAQKMKLEELMKKKRQERLEKEKQDELEREKHRIRSGKEMIEAKRKQEEQEMVKLIELRKREKQEEKAARQRVKDQIEQDRAARKAKFEPETKSAPATSSATVSSSTSSAPVCNKNYTEAKLQIRLTNGTSLTQTFGAKEPLSAVRLYVEMNRTDLAGPFLLMTSFPRKIFDVEDYDKPLDVLGLTPSAVIIVTKA